MSREIENDFNSPVGREHVLNTPKPQPTEALTEAQQKVWDEIMTVLSPQEMTGINCRLATYLCQAVTDYEDEMEALRDEGTVVTNSKGSPYMNPRFTIAEHLYAKILRLQTRIRLGTNDSDDQDGVRTARRNANRRAETARKVIEADEQSLLPRIGVMAAPMMGRPS